MLYNYFNFCNSFTVINRYPSLDKSPKILSITFSSLPVLSYIGCNKMMEPGFTFLLTLGGRKSISPSNRFFQGF